MFFNLEIKEPETKKQSCRTDQFNEIFKIPSQDNYAQLCQLLMDREERQEYVSPIFESNIKVEPRYVLPETYENRHNQMLVSSFNYSREAYLPDDNKPDDSYAYMILRALYSREDRMMALNDIYLWVEENYPYYRTAEPIWKNSIRHNLSLNPAFKKHPRLPSQRGKGGLWSVVDDPEVVKKINKKRRITRSYGGYDYSK